MNNVAHAVASFYLLVNTHLTEEEFCNKFTKENIIASKIEMTLPDGSVHSVSFADLLTIKVEEFEDNTEEATKQSA